MSVLATAFRTITFHILLLLLNLGVVYVQIDVIPQRVQKQQTVGIFRGQRRATQDEDEEDA